MMIDFIYCTYLVPMNRHIQKCTRHKRQQHPHRCYSRHSWSKTTLCWQVLMRYTCTWQLHLKKSWHNQFVQWWILSWWCGVIIYYFFIVVVVVVAVIVIACFVAAVASMVSVVGHAGAPLFLLFCFSIPLMLAVIIQDTRKGGVSIWCYYW